jgi:probable F420-dependent oxidoreductase
MKFGAAFALTAQSDPSAIRDFVQTLDDAAFDLVTVSGHVLSTESGRFADRPVVTYAGPFHDAFVLFGYLAALTQHIQFRPSVLILPLYPTGIVAKQSAELQMLSNGRFQLGVGISWNPSEYQALGQDFRSRGAREEEQVALLRQLWSEPLVTFSGRFHQFDGVGLNRPLNTPIPIWFGSGMDERVLGRIARLADGWVPLGDPTPVLPRLRELLREAGRDAASFGLTLRLPLGPEGPSNWLDSARRLEALGATYLTLAPPPDLPAKEATARLLEAKRHLAEELGG